MDSSRRGEAGIEVEGLPEPEGLVESCVGLSGTDAAAAEVLQGAGGGEWEEFLGAVGVEYLSGVYTIM